MSYGIQAYGPVIDSDGSSRLVFSDSIRTSNIQLYQPWSLEGDETTSIINCPNANDDTKVLIVFLGNPRNVDIINKTSTGFQLKNNLSSSQSGVIMALRIS